MIAHIMISEKFMPPFIDLMNEYFSETNHQYYFITSEKYQFGLQKKDNVLFFHTDEDFKRLTKLLEQAGKIILHGLWREKINALLLQTPRLLKKAYWVMWGGDFYFPEKQSPSQAKVISAVGFLVTGTVGDVDLARKWYGAKGIHKKSYVYTSNIANIDGHFEKTKTLPAKVNILLGNSASATNNHVELLDVLYIKKSKINSIIAPLSYANYSDSTYVEKIINKGNKLFSDKFVPLTKFMCLENYNSILSGIHIAVFNHDRQQGMGNIINLLGAGVKVYMRSSVSTWQLFRTLGICVFDIKKFNCEPMNKDIVENNRMLVKKHFSTDTLVAQLKTILE